MRTGGHEIKNRGRKIPGKTLQGCGETSSLLSEEHMDLEYT